MQKFPLFVIILLLSATQSVTAQVNTRASKQNSTMIELRAGWQFREAGKDDWHNATVPGCIHTDLLANKLIDDPFYRDNEKKQQWIGKTNWEYQTTFNLDAKALQHDHLDLVFTGLDTYAEVFLNDKPILKADNMFRTWRVDSRTFLHTGENILLIRFRSPINEILPRMAELKFQLPAPNDQGEKTSPYTRKAPYHYGWDWGPRFVTAGIWKPVYLQPWDEARVNNLQILVKSLSTETASITANVEIEASEPTEATLLLNNVTGRSVAGKRQVSLKQGTNIVPFEFSIAHPAMWWPNGLGEHPLYKFNARLIVKGKVADQLTTQTGLRTLELRQVADDQGKSFTFVINGVPVFAKGGNWIPADSFPSRITKEKYRYLLNSVKDSNMNMLRVWGGGIYESDDFYSICDELGILVWQDFMFACSMYPGSQEFLDNVRGEAVDNVKRLRNHPSIVLWAGNNEIEAGWMNWGWRQNLPASMWDDYKKIFLGVLQEVTSSFDPSRPYWPSSPHGGLDDDPDSARSGDLHFWRVWHFAEPFSDYEKQSPRFMSEYGFQSFPQIESVSSYTIASDHDIESPIMLAHQRHPRGNQLVREYMLRDFAKPKDFESFLYVSQVLQAEGIRVGAEHLRRIMPHNMGSLYWQIDDCWPVASWSSIDYYGRWKALQYYARRFYAPLLISPHAEKGNLNFYVVSDNTAAVTGQINIALMSFDGRVLRSIKRDVTVEPLMSKSYLGVPVDELMRGNDPKNTMLYCELVVNGKTVSSHEYFFAPFKDLLLPKPEIEPTVTQTRDGFKVALTTNNFAAAVYLAAPGRDGYFVDNYFHLIPRKPVEVEFHTRGKVSLDQFREALTIRSLVDSF